MRPKPLIATLILAFASVVVLTAAACGRDATGDGASEDVRERRGASSERRRASREILHVRESVAEGRTRINTHLDGIAALEARGGTAVLDLGRATGGGGDASDRDRGAARVVRASRRARARRIRRASRTSIG